MEQNISLAAISQPEFSGPCLDVTSHCQCLSLKKPNTGSFRVIAAWNGRPFYIEKCFQNKWLDLGTPKYNLNKL